MENMKKRAVGYYVTVGQYQDLNGKKPEAKQAISNRIKISGNKMFQRKQAYPVTEWC